jgi:hypothetical protein
MDDAVVTGKGDPVLIRLDQLDIREDCFDGGWQEIALGLNHITLTVNPKGDEQEARLVVVVLVTINNHNAPIGRIEMLGHFVSHHGAASASTEN